MIESLGTDVLAGHKPTKSQLPKGAEKVRRDYLIHAECGGYLIPDPRRMEIYLVPKGKPAYPRVFIDAINYICVKCRRTLRDTDHVAFTMTIEPKLAKKAIKAGIAKPIR